MHTRCFSQQDEVEVGQWVPSTCGICSIGCGVEIGVSGGRIVGAHVTGPGETRGTGIEGGETRQLSAGDVVVIERGTPHWFKAVEGRVEYFVVKVISR